MDKPFVLFSGDDYYPAGGWKDYKGNFATLVEAEEETLKHKDFFTWYHIVDLRINKIIQSGTWYRQKNK